MKMPGFREMRTSAFTSVRAARPSSTRSNSSMTGREYLLTFSPGVSNSRTARPSASTVRRKADARRPRPVVTGSVSSTSVRHHTASRMIDAPCPPPTQSVARPCADLAAPHLEEERQDEAGARAAHRVSEGDGPAVHVQDVERDLAELLRRRELLEVREDLRRERLVHLDEADVLHREAGLLQGDRRRARRAEAHALGLEAREAPARDAAERLQAVLRDELLRGDDDGRAAVRDLRRVAGRDGAVRRSKTGFSFASASIVWFSRTPLSNVRTRS